MKLIATHYLLDEPKILFFFSAENRVDFRDLVKDLVAIFKMRIELRQIGVRDESRITGGLGVCGRPYCCHSVTDKLKPVSIRMAKDQNLSLYPESHYGRDALVGIALFLSHLAHEGKKVSELRATYPPYFIAKNKVELTPAIDVDAILAKVKEIYAKEEINDIDGVKIDFPDKWVHLRKSNTEAIIRVYSEASTMEAAEEIGQKIMDVIAELAK